MGWIKEKDNATTVNYKIFIGGNDPFSIMCWLLSVSIAPLLFNKSDLITILTFALPILSLIIFIPDFLVSALTKKGKEVRECLEKFIIDVRDSACECYNQ